MATCVLSLGSNIEPRKDHLNMAIKQLSTAFATGVKKSKIYETEPVGMGYGMSFLNMAVCFETSIKPVALINSILEIEKSMGRIRTPDQVKDRIIDIDIIFYGDLVLNSPELQIPHPRLHERNFVLTPLLDIVPDMEHPVLKKSVWELYDECKDLSEVELLD